jgi:large subunit ribosomal protein L14
MKAMNARITHALSHGSFIEPCDNSGAKLVRIVSFIGSKTVKGRKPSGGIGQLVLVAVRKGTPEMRKQVTYAVIVRQKKEYRRRNGDRIKFEDNAVVISKDEKGNPKGTIVKGPIPKEVCDRWPPIAKLASMIV